MKQQPQNQASGASETARFFFCTRISSTAGATGKLCTSKRNEPQIDKRENERMKEKENSTGKDWIFHPRRLQDRRFSS